MPRSSVTRQSFLLDDDEDLSDMESARRTTSDDSHGVRSFFDDETPGEEKEFSPVHPLRHPPTPPLTANRLKDSAPPVDTTVFDKGLPTPGLTPTSRLDLHNFDALDKPAESTQPQEVKQESTSTEPPHLPFVLAYDSETVAQQFTIIEKDALDEIDWRELIELRWKQSSPQISDWVHYLRTEEARGVDVVIARFNLVVKWAVSEIVLTASIEERAPRTRGGCATTQPCTSSPSLSCQRTFLACARPGHWSPLQNCTRCGSWKLSCSLLRTFTISAWRWKRPRSRKAAFRLLVSSTAPTI